MDNKSAIASTASPPEPDSRTDFVMSHATYFVPTGSPSCFVFLLTVRIGDPPVRYVVVSVPFGELSICHVRTILGGTQSGCDTILLVRIGAVRPID